MALFEQLDERPAARRRSPVARKRRTQAERTKGTRTRILEAARRLFAARGYAGVTMRDIAAEAGVAVQTVHVIFGTKLSLAKGIVAAALEDVNQEVVAFLRQADEAQDLRVTLHAVGAIARSIDFVHHTDGSLAAEFWIAILRIDRQIVLYFL